MKNKFELPLTPLALIDEFRRIVDGIPYERKGILNSEMFFLWMHAREANPRRILESGRARGQSTLVLARCFPNAEIISVEHDSDSPDAAVAAERLRSEANVKLLFGDATRILPKLSQEGDVALIDGPKGFRGVRFALDLLASRKLSMVFVHDVGPATAERNFLRHLAGSAAYSDDPELVRHSHMLDNEEAMDIPLANRYAAVAGESGYGYGLGCLFHDERMNYRLLRLRAAIAGFVARFGSTNHEPA